MTEVVEPEEEEEEDEEDESGRGVALATPALTKRRD
jgi:hypothetical protein